MAPEITGLYAVPLSLMMLALSTHVTVLRTKTGISIMDGGNTKLAESIRRHGNFIENVPMILLLMAVAEFLGTANFWLHVTGLLLVAARVLHASGIRSEKAATFGRIAGGTATNIAMLIAVGNIAARLFLK